VTKGEQMPAESADERTRKRVERADEQPIVNRAFPPAVQPRLHGEPLGHDPDLLESRKEASEFGEAEFLQHRRVLVFEPDLHHRRQRVQPRDPVVDLKDREAARFQDAAALVHEPLRVCRVLNHTVRINKIEAVLAERKRFAVGHVKLALKMLLPEVCPRQFDRRTCEIDAGHDSSAAGKSRQIDAGAASDFENGPSAIVVERDEPKQMMELLEVVLVEVLEEAARSDRVSGDLEVVNVPFPVGPDLLVRRAVSHAPDNIANIAPWSRMRRDVDLLTSRTFDLLIVGGGVYGLTMACDGAKRGLDVALIERNDFGSGNSFNHLRTIHGGLRYLQTLDVARARESADERRTLARVAPHTLRTTTFALPLYRSLTKGKLALRSGFLLDRMLTGGRNDGVPPSLSLPAGHVISRSDAIDRFPGMRRQGLTGAAIWYDYVAEEADRLTFSWALGADEAGAVLANYVEAMALVVDGKQVLGVRATDRQSGRELEITARLTINTAGGAFTRLLEPLGIRPVVPLLKAMNLVTRREAGDEAVGARSASGRSLFLVPWRGRALFGTWESAQAVAPGASTPREAEVAAFIGELNGAFAGLDLSPDDVTLVHHGLVPAVAKEDGSVALEGHERIHDHTADGVSGLVSVAGAKYTTARAVAEQVIDRAAGLLGKQAAPCRTREPLPGGEMTDPSDLVASARRAYDAVLPSDTLPHLIRAYGSRYDRIAALGRENASWDERLSTSSPVIGAELVWAVRNEMAVTLADAVIRRTPLGALGQPELSALERAAAIVGAERGWSADRQQEEIRAVTAFYAQGTLKALKT
jgi:glycerol-3-phosphate dehydrogenase